MKTIEIREFGKADVLEVGTRDLPELRDSEVLVRIFAAGVNGPDLVQRRGHYPPPKGASDLLGLEISGEVVAVGKNVSNWSAGDHVCALTNGGGYAEYVAVEATHCLPIPAHITDIDAAGLCETYFTVWSNLFFNQNITKNDLLLVHGGAGGIGTTAIQLGKNLGMRVFTTCGNEENCRYVEELGAERSINYKQEDFVDVVREAGGANLILDIIGGDYIARNIKAASADARIIQLAFNAGSKVELNMMPIMLKRLTYTGSTLRSRPETFKSAVASDLVKNVWPMFEQKKLIAQTHKVFTFEQASDAHSMMEAAQHRGKILLSPN
ncbi:MAG: NAD(P)H-quinone oxidoreductase [Kordiimonadaceae bacterium]|nr:NAD(P)H-quinone oxidoreductase [Kordiimonadaceae bacterium]MBT6031045.1 NAD(P)H-quinone oxidoreductase [Kordiimonadaceae bacterium]